MHISNYGIELLKEYEGAVIRNRKHIIYNDKTGQPVNINVPLQKGATIGYGHLIKPGEDFSDGITESMATELLYKDVKFAELAVRNNITTKLTQNQFDALVIFAYNIGEKNFATSTVVKYINNPNFHSDKYPSLDVAWRAWCKTNGYTSPGLICRRNAELKLFHTI